VDVEAAQWQLRAGTGSASGGRWVARCEMNSARLVLECGSVTVTVLSKMLLGGTVCVAFRYAKLPPVTCDPRRDIQGGPSLRCHVNIELVGVVRVCVQCGVRAGPVKSLNSNSIFMYFM